jgi:hypothetical protein
MGLTQTHSGSGHEGNIRGGWFAGDHGPDGVWSSEKGRMIDAPELSAYDQDGNIGPDRLNQEVSVSGHGWTDQGPITSGQFDPDSLTRGTDKHMPK